MLSRLNLLAAFIAGAVALAVPVPGSAHNYTETFETLRPDGVYQPDSTLPGVADQLYYNLSQGSIQYADGDTVGIVPHSYPILAKFSEGPAAITAAYNGSQTAFFDLHSLWFGCVGTAYLTSENSPYLGPGQEGSVSQYPQNCTLTVKGYLGDKAEGLPVAQAKFRYRPVVQKNFRLIAFYAAMQEAVLPSNFKYLRTITLNATRDAGIVDGDPMVSIDSVSYTSTNSTKVKA